MAVKDDFLKLLNAENKEESLLFVLDLVNNKKMNVLQIYRELIIPSMQEWKCPFNDNPDCMKRIENPNGEGKDLFIPNLQGWKCPTKEDALCIWKEHVRSSIVRTIVECLYPYLIKEAVQRNGHKILIFCPWEELHELGARIGSDFLYLNGFSIIFAGNNTPLPSILRGIGVEKPHYATISVTNPYHIVSAKKIIKEITDNFPQVKILASGKAILENKEQFKEFKIYKFLSNYEDIIDLAKESKKEVGK